MSPTVTQLFSAIMLAVLVLAGCGSSEDGPSPAAAIRFDELPATPGRGYGEVTLAGIDNAQSGTRSGDRAPNFAMQFEDGRQLELADLQGQPVMLNFWATWCGPCRLEMPDIVAAAEAAADVENGLVVLAVNVQENLAAIEPFVDEFAMSMPVVRDSQGELRDLYGVRGMPTSVFIDADGAIAAVWAGVLTEASLTAMLDEIR